MSETTVGIGKMVQALQGDFPELTISKVRFLEAKGLLNPERTASGYRRFTPAMVLKLREILRLQKQEYLPLDVIVSRMDHWVARPDVETAPDEGPFTLAEISRLTGVNRALISDLTKHGVLRETETGYQSSSVAIVLAAKQVLSLGLEPRHLRSVRSGPTALVSSLQGRAEALARSPKSSSGRELAELSETARISMSALNAAINSDELSRLPQ